MPKSNPHIVKRQATLYANDSVPLVAGLNWMLELAHEGRPEGQILDGQIKTVMAGGL